MRLEKLALRSLESSVVEGVARRSFMPPSFLPEPEAPPPPPPAPGFSEEDIKQAEQVGYRNGFLEGEREGRAQAEAAHGRVNEQLTEAVAQMANHIQAMIDAYNAFAREQQATLPRLALAVAKKVAGAALDARGLQLVEATVLEVVGRVIGVPAIYITVNDALAPTLEERLIAHFSANTDPGEIHILGDASVPPGDCRINWGDGSCARETGVLWEQAEAIVQEMAGSPPAAAPAEAEPPTPEPTEPNEGV